MTRFLANENVPRDVILAARGAGHDISSVLEVSAGATDEEVLGLSIAEQRVLMTFDKDFGELVFRRGSAASCGVILLRPRLQSPEYLAAWFSLRRSAS